MFAKGGECPVEIHQALLVAGGQGCIDFAAHHLGDALAHHAKFPKMRAWILIGAQP